MTVTNTAQAIDTLTDTGFTPAQAQAVLAVVQQAVEVTACTKLDLAHAVAQYRDALNPLNPAIIGFAKDVAAMGGTIDNARQTLGKDIATVANDVANTRQLLGKDIDAVRASIAGDITNFSTSVSHQLTALQLKLTAMHSNTVMFVVLGLGGYLTVLATVLKFFG